MLATIIREGERFSITEEMRQALGLEPGAVVVVEQSADTVTLRTADIFERTDGVLHAYSIYPVPTDDELDEVIASAWAEDEAPDDRLRAVDRLYGSLGRDLPKPNPRIGDERKAFEDGIARDVQREGLDEG